MRRWTDGRARAPRQAQDGDAVHRLRQGGGRGRAPVRAMRSRAQGGPPRAPRSRPHLHGLGHPGPPQRRHGRAGRMMRVLALGLGVYVLDAATATWFTAYTVASLALLAYVLRRVGWPWA